MNAGGKNDKTVVAPGSDIFHTHGFCPDTKKPFMFSLILFVAVGILFIGMLAVVLIRTRKKRTDNK